ncbi:MAG: SET domain-containing protein-lysine N-methyltransferase [Acidobacteria bacterium]|nr:SET domain-containing protein-lysine N-methyltransferase [Acidobacteriota bacterium]
MALIVRSSSIHAAGCYTTEPIRRGARVVEYTGPRLTQKQGDLRYENCHYTYLFGLRNTTRVIDGHGIAAFINHSCDPNCETDEIEGRVWILARRNIKAAEELTYDYNLYDGDFDAPCHCGAKTCRATMYDPELTAAQERKSRRKRK